MFSEASVSHSVHRGEGGLHPGSGGGSASEGSVSREAVCICGGGVCVQEGLHPGGGHFADPLGLLQLGGGGGGGDWVDPPDNDIQWRPLHPTGMHSCYFLLPPLGEVLLKSHSKKNIYYTKKDTQDFMEHFSFVHFEEENDLQF